MVGASFHFASLDSDVPSMPTSQYMGEPNQYLQPQRRPSPSLSARQIKYIKPEVWSYARPSSFRYNLKSNKCPKKIVSDNSFVYFMCPTFFGLGFVSLLLAAGPSFFKTATEAQAQESCVLWHLEDSKSKQNYSNFAETISQNARLVCFGCVVLHCVLCPSFQSNSQRDAHFVWSLYSETSANNVFFSIQLSISP